MDDSKKIMDEMGVECRTVLATGHPASVLLDEATKGHVPDVLGSRGTGFVEGFLLGSTTTRVAHHSEIPVTIVHC